MQNLRAILNRHFIAQNVGHKQLIKAILSNLFSNLTDLHACSRCEVKADFFVMEVG